MILKIFEANFRQLDGSTFKTSTKSSARVSFMWMTKDELPTHDTLAGHQIYPSQRKNLMLVSCSSHSSYVPQLTHADLTLNKKEQKSIFFEKNYIQIKWKSFFWKKTYVLHTTSPKLEKSARPLGGPLPGRSWHSSCPRRWRCPAAAGCDPPRQWPNEASWEAATDLFETLLRNVFWGNLAK